MFIRPLLVNPIMEEKPKVDDWIPNEEDRLFKTVKSAILLDVSGYYGFKTDTELDSFYMKSKRSYNSIPVREHIVQYLNYFEKFYDKEHELINIYCAIKIYIDYNKNYTKKNLFYDLYRYFIKGTLSMKADLMNADNYSLSLTYRNKKNPALQYKNKHAILLMKISLIMNMMAPLLCHFMTKNQITKSNDFLLEIYDVLLHIDPNIDIYSKLYETAETNVIKSAKNNPGIFSKQDIRGLNITTHTQSCVINIVLNIIIKYKYNSNIIHLNFKSIHKNTGFQVLDIAYEYSFFPLSSSQRDADLNSEFDKYESFLTKADSALYLQNQVACKSSMDIINYQYGPFKESDIQYYIKKLTVDNHVPVNSFQKDLIFSLFYKYFGDTGTLNLLTLRDYIKLIIASRTILESSGMVLLPYIISSKVERLSSKKHINKKDLNKIELSPLYETILDKYKNEKVIDHIYSLIATILSSDFIYIDPDNSELDGTKIDVNADLAMEEILMYVNMI